MNSPLLRAYRERNQCRASAVLFLKHLGYEEISGLNTGGDGFVREHILTKQMVRINARCIDSLRSSDRERLIGRALEALRQSGCPYPLEENRRFFELLLNGMEPPSSSDCHLMYIDWREPDKNCFQFAVNYRGEVQPGENQRFTDIVCFINGVPLVGIGVSPVAGLAELRGECAFSYAQMRSRGAPRYFGLLQVLILLCRSGGYYTSPENTGWPWLSRPSLARDDQWPEFLREISGFEMSQSRSELEHCEMARWVEQRPVEWFLWSMCRPDHLLELLSQFRIVGSGNQPGGLIDGWGQASVRAVTEFFSIKANGDSKDRVTAVWRPENQFMPGLLEFLVRTLAVTQKWRCFRRLLILSNSQRRGALECAFRASGETWPWMRTPNELARGLSSRSGIGLIGCVDDVEPALEHCSSQGLVVESWLVIVDGDCGLGTSRGIRLWRRVLSWGRVVFVSDRAFCDSMLNALERLGMIELPMFSRRLAGESGLLVPVYLEDREVVLESSEDRSARLQDGCDSEFRREVWLHQIACELRGDTTRKFDAGARRVAVVVVGNVVDAFLLKEMLDESNGFRPVVFDRQIGPSYPPQVSCTSPSEITGAQQDLLIVPLGAMGELRRIACRTVYLVGVMDWSVIADAIDIVGRPEQGKDFGLLVCLNGGRPCSSAAVLKKSGDPPGCQPLEVKIARLGESLEAIQALFPESCEGDTLVPYEAVLRGEDVRTEFYRLFFQFHRSLFLAYQSSKWMGGTSPGEQLRLIEALRFFQRLRIRAKVRYAEDLDCPEFEGELLSLLESEDPVSSGLAMPLDLNPLRSGPFELLVASLPDAAAKGDMIACWIMKVIAERWSGVDSEYGEISLAVEAAVCAFAENSLSPHEYLKRVECALRCLRRVVGEPALAQETDRLKAELDRITYRVIAPQLRSSMARHSFALEEGAVEYMASDPASGVSQDLSEIAGQALLILVKSLGKPWLESELAENRFRRELDRYLLAYQETRGVHISVAATDEFIESLLTAARQCFRHEKVLGQSSAGPPA